MPRIEDLGGQIGAPGAADIAPSRPNQAFADLGQQSANLEGVLEQAADHDAALEGASALADFKVKRAQRQIEMRTQAKDPATFAETAMADFDEEAEKLVTGHENERVQMFLEQRLVDARAGEEVDSATWAANAIIDRRAQKTVDTVNKYANIVNSNPGQFESALDDVDAMIDAAGLPLDVADKQKSTARSALARSAVYGQMESNPGGVLKQLQGGQWDDYLDNDVKISAVNAAQSEISRREAEARAEARARRSEQREIEKDRLDAEKKLTATVSALNRVGSGALFDPRSADDRKDVDLAWEVQAETLTPEQSVPAMVRYSAQVGMVPERGKKLIRGLLRSSNDADVLKGAELIGRLRSQNAELMNDFQAEDTRLAESVLAQTDGGVPAQDALRRYREGQQISDPVRDVRKAQFGEALKAEGRSGANALRTAVGGDGAWIGWVADADVPPEAQEEFNRLRADEFIKTGSMDAATRFAGENIKRVYGVSELSGGRRVTKYAPEQWYGRQELSTADNAAWIRDQARADAAAVLGATPEGNIELTPARRVGADGRPAYVITVTKPDGERVVPMRNGKPVLFVPSFDQSPAKKKMEDEAKADADAARADKRDQVEGFKARGGTLPGDYGL